MRLSKRTRRVDLQIARCEIPVLRKVAGGKLLFTTASGIRVDVVKDALKAGADILVVGRAITASKDIGHAAEEFPGKLNKEEIDQFRVMTDFKKKNFLKNLTALPQKREGPLRHEAFFFSMSLSTHSSHWGICLRSSVKESSVINSFNLREDLLHSVSWYRGNYPGSGTVLSGMTRSR